MSETIAISLEGTTDIPAGKIATIVTSLAMTQAPAAAADPPGTEALGLVRIGVQEIERYRAIYRLLGERWMWFSRLSLAPERLAAILGDAEVEAYAVVAEGRDAGLLELDFREEGQAELAFFGLDEALLGRGAGRWLMNRALAKAWARPIRRFWVHTCTLDHPAALGFYERSGFAAFKRGVEIADDPRLTGVLAPQSAPHHPVLA